MQAANTMKPNFHYGTITEALDELRAKGFTVEFSVEGMHLIYPEGKVRIEDFEIADVYRYEGVTDPADEAVVYAVKSKSKPALKGVLVFGYGAAGNITFDVLKKMHMRKTG